MPHPPACPASLTPDPPATRGIRARLIRNGVLVVGGSIIASTGFTHLAFALSGNAQYGLTMVFAVLIPLVVASCAYGWIASLTLALETSRAQLEHLAHSDALTGLANRRAALLELERWTAQAAGPVALAIADIDQFKSINDRLGHEGGDASLVHFAAMLRRLAPEDWLVARIGGEEFLIAAREAVLPGFAGMIDAMRQTIAETPLIVPAGPYSMTASFGVAARAVGEPVGSLIARADTALYAAKQSGRNRTAQAA
ncbi:MAG: GGDEF domain-containing protein [Sphingomonadales bacterium]|nr:GGDEF domain-containing protein [Sphingomonadales bacterium]NCQ21071.1 GGDEF domain-containing protein [Sphingomonadales bacterium]NCT03860.1 GGDEF domain-containing protein [Sphingomonadales bacterium]